MTENLMILDARAANYLGLVFPRRSGIFMPVFTPQMQPYLSLPPIIRSQEVEKEENESSAEPDFPTLSLTGIQNARGIMDVIAEMLSAISPENKEEHGSRAVLQIGKILLTAHLVDSNNNMGLIHDGLRQGSSIQH